jgi:hypothetical protein
MMKKSIIISTLIAIILGLYSCDKLTEEQKNADALYKKITKTYTLNEDGSTTYKYEHELDLHSYLSFNRLYGETFIKYNPEYQKIDTIISVTETKEGKKIPSPDNAYNEVLPRFASGAPSFSHLREMVVTHTGLEKNSTINLEYQISSNKDYMPFLTGDEILAQSSPVKEMVIKVKIPKDKELNYKLLNAEQKLNISTKGKFKVYEWTLKDIPAQSHESHQPDYGTHLPHLMFSTVNFNEAYSFITKQIDSNLPEKIAGSLSDNLKNEKTRYDSLLTIQEMVTDHINYFNIPPQYRGLKIRNNEKVLEDNGGTYLEKTVLLNTLLKEAGFQSKIVAIVPDELFDKEIGNPLMIKKFFVMIKDNDEPVYLSAIHKSGQNPFYGQAGEKNIILSKNAEDISFIDTEKPKSKVIVTGNLEFSGDKLMGTIDYSTGYCENSFFKLKKNESSGKNMLHPAFPANSVKEYSLKKCTPEISEMKYKISQPLEIDWKGNYFFYKIPETGTRYKRQIERPLVSERTSPYDVKFPVLIKYNYSFNIPESYQYQCVTKDEEISKKNDIGRVEISIQKKKDKINILRVLEINSQIIGPSEYGQFRELVLSWKKDQFKELIFKKKGSTN